MLAIIGAVVLVAYLIVVVMVAISFYDDYMSGWQCIGYALIWPIILAVAVGIYIWAK